MTTPRTTTVTETDTEIISTRTLDAPPAAVWAALTEAAQLDVWWGPSGFTNETHGHDFREGGHWHYTMIGPDGQRYENRIRYLEIEENARIVYEHGGGEDHAPDEDETVPVCFRNELTLAEAAGGRTTITMRTVFPTKDAKDFVARFGAVAGSKQNLECLAHHLAGGDTPDTFIIRRVLDAPLGLVWDAWTDDAHLLCWFCPKVWRLSRCEMDLRPGGRFLYCMSPTAPDAGMPDMWGVWNIESVDAPEQLVFVVSFSDPEGNAVRAPFAERWPLEVHTTLTLEPHAGLGGGTLMTLRSVPVNAEDDERELFINGMDSMNQGWGQTLANLIEHLSARV